MKTTYCNVRGMQDKQKSTFYRIGAYVFCATAPASAIPNDFRILGIRTDLGGTRPCCCRLSIVSSTIRVKFCMYSICGLIFCSPVTPGSSVLVAALEAFICVSARSCLVVMPRSVAPFVYCCNVCLVYCMRPCT